MSKLGPMAGTLMAINPDAPKVKRFITLGGEPYLIRYNSRLPVVVPNLYSERPSNRMSLGLIFRGWRRARLHTRWSNVPPADASPVSISIA